MRWIAVFSLAIFFWSCNNRNSTQDLLDVNYMTQGQRPISLLSPANNSVVSPSNLTFVWSSVPGVGAYDFQIASDAAFTQIVLTKRVNDNNYIFQSSDLTGIPSLDSAGYYWRVKIPYVTNNLQSAAWVINNIATNGSGGSDFYVNGNSTSAVQVGTKTNPYKNIFLAVKAADVFRTGNPAIPMRILIAKGTYTESISLYAGISLMGGYDPVDWSRNIAGNTTTVTPPAELVLAVGGDVTPTYTATTVIEGLTFLAGSAANTTGTNGQVMLASASPTFRNNTFSMTGSITTVGIHFVGGSPVITGNTFTTSYLLHTGIYCNTSSGTVTVSQNIFNGTQALSAISINQCGLTISGNTIAPGTLQGSGININAVPAQPMSVVGNTLTFANSLGNARGIYIDNGASPVIANNVVTIACSSGCGSPPITAIGIWSGSPTITNNVLVSGATGNSTTVLYNQGVASPIATNNILMTTGGTSQTCHNMPSNIENNYYINCTGAAGSNTSTTLAAANFSGGTTYSYGFDFHLTAGSLAALQTGGRNAGTSVCGTAGNLNCGNVTTDKDGVARTAPYSIGAFEY